MLPRRSAPLWFEFTVAVALALTVRALDSLVLGQRVSGDGDAPLLLAFWNIVVMVAGAIWKGLEVAGRITLEALKWSVLQLWSFARLAYNGMLAVGKEVLRAARKAWDFLQATYQHVVKPLWDNFWKWFQRAKQWLESVFAPVFNFLQFIRQWILDFYAKWVRPILDVLGIAQRVLRVLEALGLEWARKLDAQLAELQRRIDQPFQIALAKINEIVNIVNRIVTLDGLIQRVALVRSIERDIREVRRAFHNWASKPMTEDDWTELNTIAAPKTDRQLADELTDLMVRNAGPRAALASELAASIRTRLGASR